VKLVLDQGVPRRATIILRESGIEAVHASEIGLSSAADTEIIAWCRENGAVVVTLDADFHAHIALSGERGPSAIRLRTQGEKGPQVGRLLVEVVRARADDLDAGALVTVRGGRLRVRRLPVARSRR
jgi:predicted nuclease of predicted toxin-antitoxin system